MHFLQHCIAIMGSLGLATAICRPPGGPAAPNTFATSDKLCVPQGEGHWTFALYISAVEIPALAEGKNAGYSGSHEYHIYDHTCRLRASYATQATDCDIPFVIEENFLQQVLTIESERTMIGGGYFRFAYGNGLFSIGNNGCGCQDMSSGLQAAQGCKCAFPISGVF